ncbi:MAG: orotidine-5'-phosphate decarboxylase [Candidatus Theseobacter exili]|nr:orotidine-5'-phosphate decarboxylase [Candidatus Theseobacter exili]
MQPEERIITALDVDTIDEALEISEKIGYKAKTVKVGSQLFTRVGPEIISALKKKGKNVFLDLKFNDIPNTVAMSAEAAFALGVKIFNVHVSGGKEMMKACMNSVKSVAEKNDGVRPVVLGVTVLTSMDEKEMSDDLGIKRSLAEQVRSFARLAKESGLDGVVASPKEIRLIREDCGENFIILTPGIRPEWSVKNDQKRIMTPSEAIKAGADYLVIGRPITNSSDPAMAFEKIVEEVRG